MRGGTAVGWDVAPVQDGNDPAICRLSTAKFLDLQDFVQRKG